MSKERGLIDNTLQEKYSTEQSYASNPKKFITSSVAADMVKAWDIEQIISAS